MENEVKITEAYNRWKQCESFKESRDIIKNAVLNSNFYKGNQHAPATEKTKMIPRVTVNMIKLIVDNKVANILGTPVKLNYIADQDTVLTDKFTKFSDYQLKQMKMDDLDRKVLKDSEIKGSGIYYFYFNENEIGTMGKYKGALCGEKIDISNFGVSDPFETDLQKQEWIIIRTRENYKNVRKQCSDKETAKLIMPDKKESKYIDEGEQGDDKVTVYTEFYKLDGDVYFRKSTKNYVVYDKRCLNPLVSKKEAEKVFERVEKETKKYSIEDNFKKENVDEDILEQEVRDTNVESTQSIDLKEQSKEEYVEIQHKANLYPFDILCVDEDDECIYGNSQISSIINNQKTINFIFSMIALQIQNMSFGKWIVKAGAIKGEISNIPGSFIQDYSRNPNSWGIQQIQGQPLSSGMMEYVNYLVELTRTVTNSGEVITGDMISKDLSGVAISQMQAQAQKPIIEEQKSYWRSYQRRGKILEMFYKLYFQNTEYSYELSPEEIENTLDYQQSVINGDSKIQSSTKTDIFNGKDYLDVPFNIVVEAGQGSQYSEIMAMSMLNTLFINGGINSMSSDQLKLFVELYPNTALPFKKELIRMIDQQQVSELNQAKQMVVQQQQVIQQQQAQIKQLGGQLQYSTNYANALQKQSIDKIKNLTAENDDMRKFMSNIPSQTGTTTTPQAT